MLMNLLPGLRQLRTPLAVGYVWLAAAWLAFGDKVPDKNSATGIIASIYRIFGELGSGVALAVLSFVAYVMGAVLSEAAIPIRLGLEAINPFHSSGQSPIQFEVSSRRRGPFWHYVYEVLSSTRSRAASEVVFKKDGIIDTSIDSEITSSAVDDLRGELPAAVVRLRIFDKPALFEEYDRLRSEAEFRQGLVAPIVALIVVLAIRMSPWILFGLALPIYLYTQGAKKEWDAQKIPLEAMNYDVIPSTSFPRYKETVVADLKQEKSTRDEDAPDRASGLD